MTYIKEVLHIEPAAHFVTYLSYCLTQRLQYHVKKMKRREGYVMLYDNVTGMHLFHAQYSKEKILIKYS